MIRFAHSLPTILKVLPFALFALLAIAIAPFLGSVQIDMSDALAHAGTPSDNMNAAILFTARLPRILLAALCGSALAAAGATFQALLRNPLATPYTLGVSSGGSLGAVIAIKLGLGASVLGASGVSVAAFAGAMATVALVYGMARSRGQLPTTILLLAGVSVAFFFSAVILFVHYIADFSESHKMLRWLMGGLDVVGYGPFWQALPFWLAGVGLMLALSRELDPLSFGSYLAHTRGVDVARTMRLAYIAASLAVSAVVAVAGPIGFVGLIVPHSVRFLIGPAHRALLPASLFAGAGFLVLCDTLARTIIAPTELPVGILTALIGGPFFIALLFKEKRKYSFQE